LILVGGGDFRFESLLDWINPSLSSVVCTLASAASSIPLVESSLPSPSCKLTFGSITLLRCAANFSVGPLSDGRLVPSLFSLVPLLAL
jgi:hypothetical protein